MLARAVGAGLGSGGGGQSPPAPPACILKHTHAISLSLCNETRSRLASWKGSEGQTCTQEFVDVHITHNLKCACDANPSTSWAVMS